jgi:hypothetical protein
MENTMKSPPIRLDNYHKLNGNTLLKRFQVSEDDNIFFNALDLQQQDWQWIRP